jgi:hypothetical protein
MLKTEFNVVKTVELSIENRYFHPKWLARFEKGVSFQALHTEPVDRMTRFAGASEAVGDESTVRAACDAYIYNVIGIFGYGT